MTRFFQIAATACAIALAASDAAADTHRELEACAAALGTPAPMLQSAPTTPLHIVSWNTKKFEREGSRAHLHSLAEGSEFVFLQESLESIATPEDIAGRVFSPGYRSGGLQTGVEIRSAFRPDVRCSLTFFEPWLRTEKAVAVLRIPFAGQNLLLANLHAINFTLGSAAYSGQLRALGTLLRAHRGPAVIGGDFNHWNPWRSGVLDAFRSGFGLEEVRFDPDWRSSHLGASVDTFLYRGLRVISAEALPTSFSDHNPIRASLLLPEPQGIPAPGSQFPDVAPEPGP